MYAIRKEVTWKGHKVSHFMRHGLESIRVRGLEHSPNWGKTNRWVKEKQWIRRLSTMYPRGLNDKIG